MFRAQIIRSTAVGVVLGLGGLLGMSSAGAETIATPTTTAAPAPATPSRDATSANIDGTCALKAGVVTCVWSPVTNPAVVRLLMLRGDGKVGRVFGPYSPSATTAVDASAKSGMTYSYVIVGLDAANKSIAHTAGVVITVP